MSISWSRALTEELINLLQARECLWNTKHCHYSDRDKRNAAINGIHDVLVTKDPLVTPKNIREKIQGLRSQFRREVRAIEASKRSGCGAADVKTPKMWCYELLQFLRPNVEIREMQDRLNDENRPQTRYDTDNNINTDNASLRDEPSVSYIFTIRSRNAEKR
ncbi:PREDICTED: uncharacterized protein LOC108361787 [Rhagoletis zephyria]|uniref:uncharacterized protein LOC108361787 n=1 Tax=Rhagoletis zephyria TaxID=28612 RepID=UPI0008112E96|nr:PREDICTED: uncharacterized protein LOC108361787 [Rhagoletis zephyria]